MLYANQALPVFSSPPTHPLTKLAMSVLTPHPAMMMIVVNAGCQSSMTADAQINLVQSPKLFDQHTPETESSRHSTQNVPDYPPSIELVIIHDSQ
jgi:hypothetical protein